MGEAFGAQTLARCGDEHRAPVRAAESQARRARDGRPDHQIDVSLLRQARERPSPVKRRPEPPISVDAEPARDARDARRAREQAQMLTRQAIAHLGSYGQEADLLRALARYIVERDH